jgi:hypothetical protein
MRTLRPLVYLAAMFLAADALADESSLRLAKFSEGEHSLQNLIKFPDVEGDVSVAVYCFADILGSGGIEWTHCFESKSVDQAFIDVIEIAIKDAEATAALVGGKKYSVKLYYRVVFIRQGGESQIGVFPNWGHDVDKYGLGYHAPQWYDNKLAPNNCWDMSGRFRAFSTMLVGTDGVAKSDVSFDRSAVNIKDKDCAGSLAALLKRSEYIPGEYEGRTVDATIVLAFGDWKNMVVE